MDAYNILVTDRDLNFVNIQRVAPYMDKAFHVLLTDKGLKSVGLQENVSLVVKWLTLNILGSSKLNVLKGLCL